MIILKYIKSLFRINPFKCSFIVAFLLLFIPFFHFDQISNTDNVVLSCKDGNKFVYLTKYGSSYLTKVVDEEIKVVNNTITYDSIHPVVIISGVFIFILFLTFIIPSFMDDEGWEFSEVRSRVLISYVRCEEEDGMFYYIYNNRLLCTSNCIQNEWNVLHVLRGYIGSENLYPIYSTKSEKRDKKISELLK